MQDSVKNKLNSIVARSAEISKLLSDPDIIKNQNKFRELSQEYAKIDPVVLCYKEYITAENSLLAAQELLKDPDPEMQQLAQDEQEQAKQNLTKLTNDLQLLLLPEDPNDARNVFLEIRAGTGGDEAALFAGDLYRMYSKYAERKRWELELINDHEGDHGGFKEVIIKISGNKVYSQLKFESGAHRVQRVPTTESQGRVHTSACTVAILPEVSSIDNIDINPSDLKIDTFRSSGAGGQHVNTTDSAIRITHLPTGVVVECQDERSQHKNKAKALSLLQARILEAEQRKQQENIAQERKSLVGSGDRSERIRTYNFPQGRVTDHRINLTLYKLEELLSGNLDLLIPALQQEEEATKLAALGHEL